MFTEGRLYFILFFVLVFIGGLVFAYRKDIKKNPKMFKGAYKTVIIILFFLVGFMSVVRLMRFF